MGYLDEDFGAHVVFALKFMLGLVILRLIVLALGFTTYWPILDDIIAFTWQVFLTGVRLIEDFSRAIAPGLP